MKTYEGVEVSLHLTFLDFGTRWRLVISFTPEEGAPGTHWIRGWMGLTVGLDAMEKRKI
jgi:hypothetical protein